MADEAQSAAGTVETKADFEKSPKDFVKNWMTAIEMAGAEEKTWREEAEAALKTYRAESDKGRSYNILFANTQTKVPALYNSEPNPDIRRRFGDTDQIGAPVADALERAITIEAEMNDFDGAMEAAVLDMELQGRGLTRLRAKRGPNGSQSIVCEPVIWDDYRRGPAKRWDDVPWESFRWRYTREELVELNPEIGREIELDATLKDDKNDRGAEVPDIFKRANVWEIWDKQQRRVIFLADSYKDGPVAVVDDPYRLRGFFPNPKPLYSVKATDTLIPVCAYTIWKRLAHEMEEYTTRIGAIVKVMKMRGLYDGAFENAVAKLQNLADGELAPLEEAQRSVSMGGLDKAIWLWPVDMAIKVVEGLYEARDRCKQTIYEITGVADILRGQTDPNETLGAQQIKAQWGSLRLQDAQRDVQKYARDLYRMMADLMAEVFEPADWALRTGMQLQPQQMAMLKSDILREFSIEIETDSTIRADLSRAQQNVAGFVTGIGEFMKAVGPAVEAGVMSPEIAIGFIRVFARNFKLGREADALLDKWEQQVEQMVAQRAQQPAQEDPKVTAAKVKAGAEVQRSQADMAKTQMGAQADQAEHGMKMQQMQADGQLAAVQTGLKVQELQAKVAAAHAMPEKGTVQ